MVQNACRTSEEQSRGEPAKENPTLHLFRLFLALRFTWQGWESAYWLTRELPSTSRAPPPVHPGVLDTRHPPVIDAPWQLTPFTIPMA